MAEILSGHWSLLGSQWPIRIQSKWNWRIRPSALLADAGSLLRRWRPL